MLRVPQGKKNFFYDILDIRDFGEIVKTKFSVKIKISNQITLFEGDKILSQNFKIAKSFNKYPNFNHAK